MPGQVRRGRWWTTLSGVIISVNSALREGIDTPQQLCSHAWEGLDHTGPEEEFRKLGNTEANGPKQRRLVLAVVDWLVVKGWISDLKVADALFEAGLSDPTTGRFYTKGGRELGKVDSAWSGYIDGYPGALALENDLVARLGGRPKAETEFAMMSKSVLALKHMLTAVSEGRKGSASDPFDNPFVLFVAEESGAGKSVLVGQLCDELQEVQTAGRAYHVPTLKNGDKKIVRLDFDNATIQEDALQSKLNDHTHQISGRSGIGSSPTAAATELLSALILDRARQRGRATKSGEALILIVLDNLASALPIETLQRVVRASSAAVDVILLVTCRPGLVARLSPSVRHRFPSALRHSEDAHAILTLGMAGLTPTDEATLGSIGQALRYWPSVLAMANRVLRYGDSREIPARIRKMHDFLVQNEAILATHHGQPDELRQVLAEFQRRTDMDPYLEYSRRRRAWLEAEADREGPSGFDLNMQFVSLRIGNPGLGSNRPKARSLADALHQAETLNALSGARHPQRLFVLTGPPGAGKSTLLRRAEWESLSAAMSRDSSLPIVLFVPLNQTPAGIDPWHYLHEEWWPSVWAPEIAPSLANVISTRPVWLLLDAANELASTRDQDFTQRVKTWVDAENRILPAGGKWGPRHRIVFSCRQRDVGAAFDRAGQFSLEAMDDEQMLAFLGRHLNHGVDPRMARDMIASLNWGAANDGVIPLFRLPLWLKLLCDHINSAGLGHLPRSRAGLMSSLLRRRIAHERQKMAGPLQQRHDLISDDQWETIDGVQRTDHFLAPKGGLLLQSLEALAIGMLDLGRTSVTVAQARALIGGEASTILDGAQRGFDLVRSPRTLARVGEGEASGVFLEFAHQQFLEYFAGRAIARSGKIEPDRIKSNWGESGPWEEAVLFAAAMVADEQLVEFITAIQAINVPLAARCAGQAGVREWLEKFSPELLASLRAALQARLAPEVGTRRAERIDCAAALFDVGHPDFETHEVLYEGKRTRFILPAGHARIHFPPGDFWIGADDLTSDERPRHMFVSNKDFWIAKYPVTNYEFACFVDASGYVNPRWWDDSTDSRDRHEHGANERIVQQLMEQARQIKALSQQDFDEYLKYNKHQPQWQRWYQKRRETPLDQLQEAFESDYPSGVNEPRPDYWLDADLNGLGQPVVGVDFYEARAYCRWINAMCSAAELGLVCDLPNEDQWEAACGGPEGRRWAADAEVFDPTRYNTTEASGKEQPVDKTTPVGAYPRGATREGVFDMTGNIWEWTLTQYVSGRARNDRPESRNEPTQSAAFRVVKGGSWYNRRNFARAAFRLGTGPFDRNGPLGFRLVFNLSPEALRIGLD